MVVFSFMFTFPTTQLLFHRSVRVSTAAKSMISIRISADSDCPCTEIGKIPSPFCKMMNLPSLGCSETTPYQELFLFPGNRFPFVPIRENTFCIFIQNSKK